MANVVHIITELMTGGGQTLMLNLVRESQKRHHVTVISLIDRNAFDLSGLDVIFLNKRQGFDLRTFFALYRTLKRLKPDVVHTHLYACLYAFPWFWLSKKRRGVHTIHSDAYKELPKIHQMLQGFLYRRRNVTPVAISDTILLQAERLYRLKPGKAKLIYNAIDTERFRCPGRRFGKNTFTLVQVAAFHPWKNQRLLLDAFYTVYQEDPSLRLVFAGDGPLLEEIKARAEQYGILDAVQFLGSVSNVEEVLAGGDAFVLSSDYEGLPMSILEAYASAMPVIATDVGGIGDILKNGENGFLAPPADGAAMAGAIRSLRRDRALCERMSRENFRYAEQFDKRTAAEAYERLYFI